MTDTITIDRKTKRKLVEEPLEENERSYFVVIVSDGECVLCARIRGKTRVELTHRSNIRG